MEQKEKIKKGSKWVVYVLIALALFVCIGLYLLWGVKDYVDKVPKITPKTQVEVKAGQTLRVEDMFDIECEGEYEMSLCIVETDISDARVATDEQTLFVGNASGTICVMVSGVGEVSEHVDAENTISVIAEE